MACLIDTSVLCRLANTADAQHAVADNAIVTLASSAETLHITAQNLVEFHNVATRPVAVNGFGLSVGEAEAKAAAFKASFPLLDETPMIFPAWKAIIHSAGLVGKQVHDARLVAVCHVHRVPRLLTFNVTHFARLALISPGLIIVDPRSL